MGLHGSSTTAIVFQDVRVPADNVLGEIGKGHKVAFNVLNFGRFKLGAACSGGAQGAIGEAVRYAAARRQFGQPIANFGAIRHKIGEMIVRAYALESLLYRIAGLIDQQIDSTPHDPAQGAAALAAVEEFAVEASIAKVAGSETLDFVLDENIQIHGGNGFVRDYPAERHFRDARVNRIFEGTNEINRLLIPGMLARRAVKGDLALIPAAKALREELLGPPQMQAADDSLLGDERRTIDSFKKTALMVLGLAMETFGQQLNDQQEVLMHAADILIDVFSAESSVVRAQAAAAQRVPSAALQADAARIFVNDAGMRIDGAARQALAATVEGDTLRTMLAALRRLVKLTPINTVALRRRICEAAVARAGYVFWIKTAETRERSNEPERRNARSCCRHNDDRLRVQQQAAGGSKELCCGNRLRAREQGRGIQVRLRFSRPRKPARRASAARVLPYRSGLQDGCSSEPDKRHDCASGAHFDRWPSSNATSGLAGIRLEGPDSEVDGVRGSRRARPEPSVRPIHRPYQRHRDVPGRSIPGSRSQRYGHLRNRLQSCLLPVLLLQSDLRVPVSAAREPPEDADQIRRAVQDGKFGTSRSEISRTRTLDRQLR